MYLCDCHPPCSAQGLQIVRVFQVMRPSEMCNFSSDPKLTRLLFHASRPENFVGILSRYVPNRPGCSLEDKIRLSQRDDGLSGHRKAHIAAQVAEGIVEVFLSTSRHCSVTAACRWMADTSAVLSNCSVSFQCQHFFWKGMGRDGLACLVPFVASNHCTFHRQIRILKSWKACLDCTSLRGKGRPLTSLMSYTLHGRWNTASNWLFFCLMYMIPWVTV